MAGDAENDEIPTTVQPLGFMSYNEYQAHLRQIHPPTCPHCSQSFESKARLRQHVEIHHEVPVEARKKFVCTYGNCDKAYTKNQYLKDHIRTVHEGLSKFVCGEYEIKTLTIDVGVALPDEDNVWRGPGCGRPFATKASLCDHIRTQHLKLPSKNNARKMEKYVPKPRIPKSKANPPSALMRLTGAGYDTATGRDIACVAQGCSHRFYRMYDMERHLEAFHGIGKDHVRDAMSNNTFAAPDTFWTDDGGNNVGFGNDEYEGVAEYDEEEAMEALDREMGISASLDAVNSRTAQGLPLLL